MLNGSATMTESYYDTEGTEGTEDAEGTDEESKECALETLDDVCEMYD